MFFNLKKKIKVLLVDDDPDMLNFMKLALKGLGLELHTSPDAIEGLEALKKHGNFDLLVTDIMMPEMNGVVFLEHVKVFYPNLKICVCSSGGSQMVGEHSADKLIELALEKGALNSLRKPFTREEFKSFINSLIKSEAISISS